VGGDGMDTTAWRRTQGDLYGTRTVFMLTRAEEPPYRSQSTHRSDEAP